MAESAKLANFAARASSKWGMGFAALSWASRMKLASTEAMIMVHLRGVIKEYRV